MFRDEAADLPALVCQVGSTTLSYRLQAIEDLHAWLLEQGDWVPLGAADENKDAAVGTVEAWGRSPNNPVGGWYGLRKGYRGRFAMYLPPLLERLGAGRGHPRRPQQPDAGRQALNGAGTRSTGRMSGPSWPARSPNSAGAMGRTAERPTGPTIRS